MLLRIVWLEVDSFWGYTQRFDPPRVEEIPGWAGDSYLNQLYEGYQYVYVGF